MNPAFLLPAGFAALVALALPLLIHLARRTEQRPTDFAALRWLRAKPRPRHRPRFDELLLLAIRLLLLAIVALWLARPVLRGSADGSPVVAVVPGVEAGPLAAGERGIWLAPGFPALDERVAARSVPVASLLRELDADLPAGVPLTAVVPAQLSGADTERPTLSRAVTWRVMPAASAPAAANALSPPDLLVRYAPDRAAGIRYFRAASVAWMAPGREPVFSADSVDRPVPAGARYLVWLAPGDLPPTVLHWIGQGGVALVDRDTRVYGNGVPVWRDTLGSPLIDARPLGRGRILQFTRTLSPKTMPELLDPDFPDRLRDLLMPPSSPVIVSARDYRPQPGGPAPGPPARNLQPPIGIALAALWIAERWLATRRRRAVAP